MQNKKVVLVGIVIALLLVAVAWNVLLKGGYSTSTTSASTTIFPAANASDYLIKPSLITDSSGKYVVIESDILPGSISGSYLGVQYTAIFEMLNASLRNSNATISSLAVPEGVPIQAYSIVYICNASRSAQNIFQIFANRLFNKTDATNLNVPQIGDESEGFVLANADQNQTLFLTQFTYNNIYAKIGIYETPGSKTPSQLAGASAKLLETIKSGRLTN
jgi:hypothetical protein